MKRENNMVKAASPIRLQKSLMDQAAIEGKLNSRSATEQAEYWMDIGRRLSRIINSESLLSVTAGLATINIEPVKTQVIDAVSVFKNLEQQRKKGTLSSIVTSSTQVFQASREFPGYLEYIDEHKQVTVGQFRDGEFIPRQHQ